MTDIQQIRDTIELTHNPDSLITGAARLRILGSAEEYVTTLLDYIDRIGADEEAPVGDVVAGVDGQEAAR